MAQTPTWGLPYPEQSTPITDSAAIIQELAEKIDAALSAVTASDSYAVPGTLIANMTTSGTFTPPPGVTVVHVAVIGGGTNGYAGDGNTGMPGGGGGTVRVFRGVPVSDVVTVTIGGANTGSSFGALTAPSRLEVDPLGRIPAQATCNMDGIGYGGNGAWTAAPNAAGRAGVQINGTYYGGGGGGGQRNESGSGFLAPGGAGGGGAGGNYNNAAGAGAGGTGGGGGGNGTISGGPGGPGGSGRVIVFTEQAYKGARAPLTHLPDPHLVAALDADGMVLGLYSVVEDDPSLPGVPHAALVPFPADPQDTGRTVEVPADPDDPDGPTVEVPVLAWPEAGWIWTDTDGWKEPA